ncbi:hypothetical protein CkaCkLH20_13338 [Colletotrichum karsti]|uniref:Uncharacterized protein n=1 Tax=Colletotrichum karsti TaxID=1095194 RepID=A0A9P6LE63_9PEZI|nr:uncharacterized protein CkaCkLH20_13338 [Colletotrichum karsti]KAF9869190.1 hypothetical protein CkaCkLH20_13338 [Colletotrichum karsti]
MLAGLKPAATSDRLPDDLVFRINFCDWKDIALYLKELFTATMSKPGYSGTAHDALDTSEDRSTLNLGTALSQVDDVEALMRQIADSMTEVIRTSPNSTAINGQALSSVTYIDIAWPRLALPVSIIILSSLTLVIIMGRSYSRGVPTWKSSSLALLFYELEGWSGAEREARGPEDLEDKANRMKGQIMSGSGSLAFSKAE